MPLPKRPAPYIVALLLLLLTSLTVWMFYALSASSVQEAAARKKTAPKAAGISQGLPGAVLPAPGGAVAKIDPAHQELVDSLHSPDAPPERDLEIIDEFIDIYSKAFGDNPVGDNADITAALTGTQFAGQQGHVLPQSHRVIRDGQLVDRWGTPFWFHPSSGKQLEIRSAGPDKELFTSDDVVINPSPPGLGVTPDATSQSR